MATRTSNMVSPSEDPPYVDERESWCIATAFNGAPNAGSNATFTHPQVNINHTIIVKLNKKNHLLWESQVSSAIREHNPQEFIAGKAPPNFSSIEVKASGILDLSSLEWQQQD